MTLESNIVNEIRFLQFNDEKAMNAIGADDWIKLQQEIDSFENSDQKYLVIKHINGNYSAGAQLGETVNALMDDVSKAAIKLWNCKKPIISLVKELMMTSNEINGEELDRLGVLYKLTNAENMDTEFKNLIENLNKQSFISICMVKQQIKDGLDLTFEKSIANETINQNSRFQHSDVIEGMNAFFEKRQPNYKNTLDE